jgi:hypothetical protein
VIDDSTLIEADGLVLEQCPLLQELQPLHWPSPAQQM